MSAVRTAWHPPFVALITERAPASSEVQGEVQLTVEPQRADLLLIRREGDAPATDGRVLRRIWRRLSAHALVEFKSVSKPPRPGDWVRLHGYGAQYHAPRIEEVGDAENLTLVMVTAAMTPTLEQEARMMRWALEDLGGGYYRALGSHYPSFLVLIDEVAESEKDPLLGAFGHRKLGVEDREQSRCTSQRPPGGQDE